MGKCLLVIWGGINVRQGDKGIEGTGHVQIVFWSVQLSGHAPHLISAIILS